MQPKNAAEQYIEAVHGGAVIPDEWITKVVERHVNELALVSETSSFRFDVDSALHALRITNESPSEASVQALIWIMAGWKRADGTQRFSSLADVLTHRIPRHHTRHDNSEVQ